MSTVGQRIKSYRKKMNMRQTELARLVGVTQGHISNLETNDKEPSLSILTDIAKVFGVTVSRLLGERSPLSGDAYDALTIVSKIEELWVSDKTSDARDLIEVAREMPYFADLNNLATLEISLSITYLRDHNYEKAVRVLNPWSKRLGELAPGPAAETLYWLARSTRLTANPSGSDPMRTFTDNDSYGDYTIMVERAIEMLREAKSLLAFVEMRNRPELRALVELELGYCYSELGDSDEALENMKQAEIHLSPRAAFLQRVLANLMLGMATEHYRTQSWEQCVSDGLRALELFRKTVQDAEGESNALHTVANAMVALERREDALRTYHEAYALAKDTSPALMQAILESAAASGLDLSENVYRATP